MKKEWENYQGEDPVITLQLKRKRQKFEGSKLTSLQLNLYDANGNFIRSSTYTNVYAGGSVELSASGPNGMEVNLLSASAEPATVNTSCFYGFCELTNLSENLNVVNLYSDITDSLLIEHFDFSSGPQRFSGYGNTFSVEGSR